MPDTLFDKYGGVPFVTDLVRDFYKQVMKRPNLRRYFEGVPVDKLITHQINYVSTAMGRPVPGYYGRNIREVHHGLAITNASFTLMMDLFDDALTRAGVTEEDIPKINSILRSRHDDVVGG
jgi:hemoglobin